ncbi:serine/threonine protein kinase [Actinoplanes sp. TBRC 11911]|uniref:serine/threonine-protein kinase n=1 Tax=Actinoplanes sp. TBRC 11911 TaxID=2729386 RepID=UPI00145D463D|nr:serine/threonine-protein kinase [Actinoplanes sp. TBRC 11911]NMO55143.1 serine/threonine protein kinase [Actinoplanes sp. TBRC 11911]
MTEEPRVVVGRYRLLRPLGQGGMGAVWAAHDELLGRDVAVKEIWVHGPAAAPVDEKLARRALREAQAAARLRHPGIVTIHDVVTEDGRPWIVMELVPGRTLAAEIAEHGLLTEQRTGEIGLKVLDALRAAHAEGIAHRDVKPANILLDGDRVVLTDFGIAAIDDATALTATGHLIGSPAYMAPERINGKPATAASDLWSLGVTLYATVTGRSPFQRDDTQATVAAVLGSKPLPPPYAGRLWPVIKGLLDKDPESRLTAVESRPLLETVASLAETKPRRPRRWPGARRKSDTVVAPAPTLAATTANEGAQRTVPIAAGTAEIPRPRGRRRRRVAVAIVGAVAVAGVAAGTLWVARADSGRKAPARTRAMVEPLRSAGSASTAAKTSPSSGKPSVTPLLDPCLVGTWRMTSMQIKTSDDKSRYSGAAGATLSIRPDGRTSDDFTKSALLSAAGLSDKWRLRGKETTRVETRGGRIFVSEVSGGHRWEVVRNGRTVSTQKALTSVGDFPYICTEARWTQYGGSTDSTDTWARVSHQP